MRRLPFLLFVVAMAIAVTGCEELPAPSAPVSLSVDIARIEGDIAILSSIKPPRNYGNLDSLNRAARHIREEFARTGCAMETQPFQVKGNVYTNEICSFGPQGGPLVVVGAHYDVAGDTPGADDNASGVAGLLELARLLAEQKPHLVKRIELVAYSLEEPPFFRTHSMGSHVHAGSLMKTGRTAEAMLCLESIGYYSARPGSQGFPAFFFRWFYPDRGDFVMVVGKWGQGKFVRKVKALMAQGSAIPVESVTATPFLPGIDLSDHLNYWKFGIPAAMVTDTAFYRNPHYHEPSDTPDKLDTARLAEVVKGVYRAVVNL
jgi:hypothetical protein